MIDPKTNEIVTVGRRKRATARVRLIPGTGKYMVNGRPVGEYLARETLVQVATQPLDLLGLKDSFDIRARCDGGGLAGQAGALRLGIARAIAENDENLRPALRTAGLLTRDAREVERKKPGQPGARKRFQFSKR
ncbi:MAG TPA: 30S ribosomal protein S9 [Candidatus Hydrogenedentes bacterium]|nr:30S ribosomal protein S9 [Candidatus Hydrogenedentota bacterium]HOC72110.1 30S ribosomal protein S9 [Candidatus Hydrogenedentota bacterium]HQL94564.1 30S ribosomal protein S9 [Candidatus Hydrogenedentota bacterium]HRZ16410.1 30S ribosomal protein S9 [Candidatus Hydrogenedentota bacterium]HRZ81377.1 30S ribosomal protein S9 [Candidatus Hydrogenedentota bacterium]